MYSVVLIGCYMGSKCRNVSELKDKIVKDKDIIEDFEKALEKRKRLNKNLTKAEKEYYKMKYVVAEVKDGKFTGKLGKKHE